MRINRPVVGFLLGATAPLIGFLVVYAVLGQGSNFSAFITYLSNYHKFLATVISLSILANLIPFLIFTNKRMDYAARGVFIATMLYAVAIILLKIIG